MRGRLEAERLCPRAAMLSKERVWRKYLIREGKSTAGARRQRLRHQLVAWRMCSVSAMLSKELVLRLCREKVGKEHGRCAQAAPEASVSCLAYVLCIRDAI